MADLPKREPIPDGEYTATLEEVNGGKMVYRITRGPFTDRFLYVPVLGEETLSVTNITVADVRRKA